MLPPRPLIKGPLHPPKQQTNPSPTSYSQRAIARGELWLEKRPRNSGGKGVHTRFSYQNGLGFLGFADKLLRAKRGHVRFGQATAAVFEPGGDGAEEEAACGEREKGSGLIVLGTDHLSFIAFAYLRS